MNAFVNGQTVRHFGIVSKVIGFDADTGCYILRKLWNNGERWVAKAEDCEAVSEAPPTRLSHRDGFVAFQE